MNCIKRKVTAWTLIFVMMVTLVGCSNSETSQNGDEDAPTIAVLLQRSSEKRYNAADIPSMKATAEELGYNITIQSAENDSETQQQQAEIAIMQGAACIILQAVNVKAGASIVKAAKEEGIPVIAYNDIVSDCALDGFAGRDSWQLGYDEASRMIELYPEGNYVIVGGDESAAVARLMTDGYKQALAEKGANITVVSEQFNKSWSAESALKQVEGALLANNDNITAVLSNNDSMAAGVIQALSAVGIAGQVGVCGQDCEDAALAKIESGEMTFTAFTEFTQMGEDAIKLADAAITGTPLEGTTVYDNGEGGDVTWLPTEVILVDQDNLAEFKETHSWWIE